MAAHDEAASGKEGASVKKDETLAFLTLAVLLAPALAVIFVGGYGFIIWMSHLTFGPPAG